MGPSRERAYHFWKRGGDHRGRGSSSAIRPRGDAAAPCRDR